MSKNKFFEINPEIFTQAAKEAGQFSGSTFENKWFKPEGNRRYAIRVLPPYSEEGSFFRLVKQHSGNSSVPASQFFLPVEQGKKPQLVMPVCFNYMFNVENNTRHIIKKAVEMLKLTKEDIKQWKELRGCPICQINSLVRIVSNDKDLQNAFYARNKYFINIYIPEEEKVYQWGISAKLFGEIKEQYDTYLEDDGINIFDPETGRNITLSSVGEKINRRYSISRVADKASAIPDNVVPFDLDGAFIDGIRDYKTIIQLINDNLFTKKLVLDNPGEFGFSHLIEGE